MVSNNWDEAVWCEIMWELVRSDKRLERAKRRIEINREESRKLHSILNIRFGMTGGGGMIR